MFTPADVLSAYSLLKSPMTVEEYVASAKNFGYTTIVLSEWQNVSSIVKFYNLAHEQQLKPVLAMQFLYAVENITLIAVASNNNAYRDLLRLASVVASKKAVDLSIYPSLHFLTIDTVSESLLLRLLNVIPSNQLLVSIYARQDSKSQYELAKQFNLTCIANRKVRYINPDDHIAMKILEAIDDNEVLPRDFEVNGPYGLLDSKTFEQDFVDAGLQSVLEETAQFYNACQVTIEQGKLLLPKFSDNAPDMLRQLAFEGLKQRQLGGQQYVERLEKELTIIIDMGFADYFLIVWDVMKFAHESHIMTGAGRGSSAASLVSYCLFITDVDPVANTLLFERFLNPERYTMPDIDLDFPDNQRDRIIEYVVKKYTSSHVAQIATFGTFAAKQALRDVGRVLGLNAKQQKTLTSALPRELKPRLSDALEKSTKLRQIIENNELYKKVFSLALKIENLPRHISTHAAGVIISDKPLIDYVALIQESNGTPLTQLVMQDIEKIGLLKMDLLGLRNLSILDTCQRLIRQTNPNFSIKSIDYNDRETLRIFQTADTEGVFQFESAGIKQTLKLVHPESLTDITAVNALYRPGPMAQIPHFSARKNGSEVIEYPHASLQHILEETYGIIVYQEQVMQIAVQMASFTLGGADLLRRAIGKMQKDIMLNERDHFIQGARLNGYTASEAESVYAYIEKFASYGFPKSHALAYSVLAYQLAYVKAHYPNVFYTALIQHADTKGQRFNRYIEEAKQKGVAILKPNINTSEMTFSINETSIQFGLGNIAGVRKDIVKILLDERRQFGIFKSFESFMERIPQKIRRQAILEPLIFAGALDDFVYNRQTMYEAVDEVGQTIAYGLSVKVDEVPELDLEVLREKEQQLLNYSFQKHPLEKYAHLIDNDRVFLIQDVHETPCIVLGVINRIKRINDKNNQPMAFVTLKDLSSQIELTVFASTYRNSHQHLVVGELVAVEVQKSASKRSDNYIATVVERLDTFENRMDQRDTTLFIKVASRKAIQNVASILKEHAGYSPVVFYVDDEKKYVNQHVKYTVLIENDLMMALKGLLGEHAVVVRKKQ